MLKIYLTGIVILVSAIVLNILAGLLGIVGWYDFLTGLMRDGKLFLRQLGVLDYAWLFVCTLPSWVLQLYWPIDCLS